jgi:hypothetical protein
LQAQLDMIGNDISRLNSLARQSD